jgi:hypothetical protein
MSKERATLIETEPNSHIWVDENLLRLLTEVCERLHDLGPEPEPEPVTEELLHGTLLWGNTRSCYMPNGRSIPAPEDYRRALPELQLRFGRR